MVSPRWCAMCQSTRSSACSVPRICTHHSEVTVLITADGQVHKGANAYGWYPGVDMEEAVEAAQMMGVRYLD